MRIAALTILALCAFAANSLFCRLALADADIDAAGFTAVRLVSGAVLLGLMSHLRKGSVPAGRSGSWVSGGMLFIYAICFSFAYLSLSAGTGALILFAAVQMTMISSAVFNGERLFPVQWLGIFLAMAGLTYLVFPGLSAPDPAGAVLMAAAGIAWGVYSLRGRSGGDPLSATVGNFIRSVPMVLFAALFLRTDLHFSSSGVLWAVASGAVASGLGYVIWYAALKGLSAARAATVQLSVPVLAAAGGVLFLSEPLSIRLVFAAAAILGGLAMVIAGRER